MGGRLFTDKLVFGRLEGVGAWSLDSATPCQSLLTMPTQVACQVKELDEGRLEVAVDE